MPYQSGYSVSQTAKILDVSERTIRNWIKKGRFPGAFKLDPLSEKSTYLIPVKDVQNFIDGRKQS